MGRIPGIGAVALGGVGIYLPINILFYGGEPAVWRRRRSPGSHCVRGGRQEKGGKISGLLPLIVCGVVFSFSLLVLPAVVNPAYSVLAVYGAQAITDVAGVLFIVMLYRWERKG